MMKKLKEICFNADEDKSNNKDQSKNLTQPNCPKEASVTRPAISPKTFPNSISLLEEKNINLFFKQIRTIM